MIADHSPAITGEVNESTVFFFCFSVCTPQQLPNAKARLKIETKVPCCYESKYPISSRFTAGESCMDLCTRRLNFGEGYGTSSTQLHVTSNRPMTPRLY